MAVNLKKGQKVDLTKTNPGLIKITVGLGWDTNKYDGGFDFDLDAVAFLLSDTGKVSSEKEFIFYNNPKHTSEAVIYSGDNRTGVGEGDDETINIDLAKVPNNIQRISFAVTIYDAEKRKQNFGQVSNAFIRVINQVTNEELVRYDLGEDFSIETAVIIADLYRHGSDWKFNAIGSGFQGGLTALCNNFGLAIQ